MPLAADISYLTGTIVLLALLLSGRFEQPDWSALGQAPRWSLLGGVLGAWYITSSTYFVSVLGTTLTLGLVVGGQAIVGVITDHGKPCILPLPLRLSILWWGRVC